MNPSVTQEPNSPLEYIQASFNGGLNQAVDPTRIGKNEYPLLINGRCRYDILQPIKMPLQETSLPVGNFQGVYAASNFGIVFIDGKAYYRDYGTTGTTYIQIKYFQMDPAAKTLWAELVPASTLNFKRFPASGDITSTVSLSGPIGGTPQCLIVQDGVSQPWIITPDAKARLAHTYAQWSVNDREYVPIGSIMMFAGGILYLVAPDGRQIYRSVSGRPLDFMVNVVPVTSDKPDPLEINGGAQTSSHRVGYDPITAMAPLNSPDGGFFVSTTRSAYKVVPDFTNPVWGEPQFDNTPLFPTGSLNQFSFVDILGDSAFIDFTGIRSFNAVLQFRYEGKNSPFSAKIFNIFKDIIQTMPCAGKFDNLALFSMQTIYGQAACIYDEISNSWVGMDQYPNIGTIKQFAEIKTTAFRKLLFITDDNKLYEAFGSTTTAPMSVYVGEWCSNDPKISQTGSVFKIILVDAKESGTCKVTPIVDRVRQTQIIEPITATIPTNPLPLAPPFGIATADTVRVLTFDIGRVKSGWKIGIFIELDCDASISHVSLGSMPEDQDVPPEEEAASFSRFRL